MGKKRKAPSKKKRKAPSKKKRWEAPSKKKRCCCCPPNKARHQWRYRCSNGANRTIRIFHFLLHVHQAEPGFFPCLCCCSLHCAMSLRLRLRGNLRYLANVAIFRSRFRVFATLPLFK